MVVERATGVFCAEGKGRWTADGGHCPAEDGGHFPHPCLILRPGSWRDPQGLTGRSCRKVGDGPANMSLRVLRDPQRNKVVSPGLGGVTRKFVTLYLGDGGKGRKVGRHALEIFGSSEEPLSI